MIYVQNTLEKSIFCNFYEDNPLGFLEKRNIDTKKARAKIKELRKKLSRIENLINKVEQEAKDKDWHSFKEELPAEKTNILIKKEYTDEEISEYDNLQEYEKVDYLTGILKGGILYAGDRTGGMKVEITNEEIQNEYLWRYIENEV